MHLSWLCKRGYPTEGRLHRRCHIKASEILSVLYMVYSDSKTNKIAASANAIAYSSDHNKNYIEALRYSSPPKVLDLGAGDGSATIPFLEMGAEVTAVDIAEDQLKLLQRKSSPYGNKLHVRCGDALEVMKSMQHTQQHFN